MLSVSIDSLTRELDDVRAQKAVVQNALLRESVLQGENTDNKISDVTLNYKSWKRKEAPKDVYETTERELTLSRDRLLAEIARERRNRGMFSPEQQQHQQHQRDGDETTTAVALFMTAALVTTWKIKTALITTFQTSRMRRRTKVPAARFRCVAHAAESEHCVARQRGEGERANNAFSIAQIKIWAASHMRSTRVAYNNDNNKRILTGITTTTTIITLLPHIVYTYVLHYDVAKYSASFQVTDDAFLKSSSYYPRRTSWHKNTSVTLCILSLWPTLAPPWLLCYSSLVLRRPRVRKGDHFWLWQPDVFV